MSITAVVTNYVKFTGDIDADYILPSGVLPDSAGAVSLITLANGDNVISVPDVDGFTVHGVAIVPPNGNTEEIILKGTAADTGIVLSASGVSVIRFGATPPVDITLEIAAEVAGFRFIWF